MKFNKNIYWYLRGKIVLRLSRQFASLVNWVISEIYSGIWFWRGLAVK